MKAKKIIVLLFIISLYTGCAAKPNDNNSVTTQVEIENSLDETIEAGTKEAGSNLDSKRIPVESIQTQDYNINIYEYDNMFSMCQNGLLFLKDNEAENAKPAAYAIEGDELVQVNCESFDFALEYDMLYPLEIILPHEAYENGAVKKLSMNLFRYDDREVYCFTDTNNITHFPEKAGDKLLICNQGMGYQKDYYEYNPADGTFIYIFEELNSQQKLVENAEFSGDLSNAAVTCNENGGMAYYYADIEKNEYVNFNDLFDVNINYVNENGLEKEAEFIWLEGSTYMIVVQSDNGSIIYKCDFAAKKIETVSDGHKYAHVVRCMEGGHADSILIIDEGAAPVVFRPGENKTFTLDKYTENLKNYDVEIDLFESEDIIYLNKNMALIIKDNDEAVLIEQTEANYYNTIRQGDNILIFRG